MSTNLNNNCSTAYTNSQARLLERLDQLFRHVGVKTTSVKATAKYLLATRGPGGIVTYADIEALGYSHRTAIWVAKRLCGLKVLERVSDSKGGRGNTAQFRITFGYRSSLTKDSRKKTVKTKTLKALKTYKHKHSKDAGASSGVHSIRGRDKYPSGVSPKRDLSSIPHSEAQKIKLIMRAPFYRQIMQAIRFGLEGWTLSEPMRDALEGFFGNRIDGASLARMPASFGIVSGRFALI